MELAEYRSLYELEDELWWFRGMERISMALLGRFLDDTGPKDVLDAGCGTGGMLAPLGRLGRVTGLDRSPDALRFAARRSPTALVRSDVGRLPFAGESFDVVTSFDVLYHLAVTDDVAALREIARVLRPKGLLLLRVPANERLRSRHDVAVHTRQRYERPELVDKLTKSGLEPVFVSFANTLLYPIAVLRRRAERLTGGRKQGSEVEAVGPLLNRWLELPLRVESWLLPSLRLPFGLSLVAVARKPAS